MFNKLGNKTKNRKFGRLLGVGVPACIMLVASGCGSTSSSTTSQKSTSTTVTASSSSSSGMPDAAYFRGKTITLIAPDAVGGDGDLAARLIAPGLAKELGATVNVTNMPGGGSVIGTNALYAANPNGLTIGIVHAGTDIVAEALHVATGVKFHLSKFSWIGNVTELPFVVMVQPNSPYKTFADLVNAKTPITDITSTTDTGLDVLIDSVFHIPVKLVSGFPSGTSEKAAFLAHTGVMWNSFLGLLRPVLAAGQAKALAISSEPTLPSLQKVVKGVPTFAQEVKALHLTLTSTQKAALQLGTSLPEFFGTMAAPPGLSAGKLQTLRTAFDSAMKLASTKSLAAKSHEPLNFVSGANTLLDLKSDQQHSGVIASLKSSGTSAG